MGEHPPVSFASSVLENPRPLAGAGPPFTAQNPTPANHLAFQDYSANSNTNSQHLSLHQDPSFQSLIQKARSHSHSHRPSILYIVLQLQQAVACYFLHRSTLPLPAPASLSASLSLHMPRTPVKTPLSMPIDNIPKQLTSGKPSPSCPSELSELHYLPLAPTTTTDLASCTKNTRPTRYTRSTHARQSPSTPFYVPAEASRAGGLPMHPSLAPSWCASATHANTGSDLGPIQ
jgi:hypothetical protein